MTKSELPNLFEGFGLSDEEAAVVRRPGRTLTRLIEGGLAIREAESADILFQHAVLCQTCLPYRDPGAETIEWERRQGRTILAIEARKVLNPETEQRERVGLPFGPKPRLILAHLNTRALRTGENVIEVADSLTAFARELLGYPPNGKEARLFKQQLARLAAADFQFHRLVEGERGKGSQNTKAAFVKSHDLWLSKDEKQRVLWPSTIVLDPAYFASLQEHAVPLNQAALANLAHSAMALDIYAWLGYRLHRVPSHSPQFIPWTAVKSQFGWQYQRIRKFRDVFRVALRAVGSQYPDARLDDTERGLTLYHSKPPIARRLLPVQSGGKVL